MSKREPTWKWLLALLTVVPNFMLSGWLLTYVWGWFVVGPFGAPPLESAMRPLVMTLFLFGYAALIHAFQ